MPGVTVLPPPPPHPFSPKMQNGLPVNHRDVVAEIKTAAVQHVQTQAREATPLSLLRQAREQLVKANTLENEGNLKGALRNLVIAAQLLKIAMNKQEKSPPGSKSQFSGEFVAFTQNEGRDLVERTHSLEAKIRDAEAEEADSSTKSGGSIADRLRMLQDHGLKDVSSKRASRELPTLPSVPTTRPNRLSVQDLPPPLVPSSSLASPIVATSSTSPSPHTLIPASSFRKEDSSPTSSPASSPHVDRLSLAEFNQTFPSIDELDEMHGDIPPPPPSGSSKVEPTSAYSPTLAQKSFPLLPLDPGPRPSSTPIPVTIDTTFVSRPASPSQLATAYQQPPGSPVVPHTASNLQLNFQGSRSPLISQGGSTPIPEKRDFPKVLFPKTLYGYLHKPQFKVLILDVRTRERFDAEHIKSDAIVCIEPSILLRENVSANNVQDALSLAPRDDSTLFSNRDKFDLVAICDEATTGNSPVVTALINAIFVDAIQKPLKNFPLLLVGGMAAWKAEFGDAEIVGGGVEAASSSVGIPTPMAIPMPDTPNLVNGFDPAMVSSPSPGAPLDGLGTPHGGTNGIFTPFAPFPNHSRTPAEIASPSFSSPPQGGQSARGKLGGPSSQQPMASTTPDYKMWIPPSNVADQFSRGEGPPPVDLSRKPLSRQPAMIRPSSNSISSFTPPPVPEIHRTHHVSASVSVSNGSGIQYPTFQRHVSPQISGSGATSFQTSPRIGGVSVPPQASINPFPLSRRRSDYIDQSQEALSGMGGVNGINGMAIPRGPIDYPDLPALPSQPILRPPPAVASHSMERQDNRPRLLQQSMPKPPTIASDYPVTYWSDLQIGTSGLKNLGNTCYMNSTIQCLSATVPFSRFFTDGRWKNAVNTTNTEGTRGYLAHGFASLLRDMWQGEGGQYLSPVTFRRTLCTFAPAFGGTEQHDCQEFLSILLDKLHEDLNRVLLRPNTTPSPEHEARLEKLPIQIASEEEWQIYRMRSDSIVVDYFQGQYQSRLECMTCRQTSTTYNAFMFLQLPLPASKSKVSLTSCLDAFVKEEVLEKGNAWTCPKCKQDRRATKKLTLSRLPPVLLIQLKRFSANGRFTDKIDTMIDFPLKSLDLTNYMPPPLPPGVGGMPPANADDPRSQVPPYRYDLYAVTNHFGTLSGGHYTAFVLSKNRWLYCDDSRIAEAKESDVVGKPAYMLYYKRVKV